MKIKVVKTNKQLHKWLDENGRSITVQEALLAMLDVINDLERRIKRLERLQRRSL